MSGISKYMLRDDTKCKTWLYLHSFRTPIAIALEYPNPIANETDLGARKVDTIAVLADECSMTSEKCPSLAKLGLPGSACDRRSIFGVRSRLGRAVGFFGLHVSCALTTARRTTSFMRGMNFKHYTMSVSTK